MTVTYTPIKKNTASQVVYCSVFSQATGQFKANPTIAVGDFQRSIDGAGFANMDAIPVVTPAGGKSIAITLSAAETNCDRLVIVGSDQAGAEWDDVFIEVEITPNSLEDLADAIGTIGSGTGAALNFAATGDNTGGAIKGIPFVGVQTSGTYASTAAEDGTYHVIDDTANEIDIIYSFSIGAGRNAAKVTFKGYLSGNGDTVVVKAYNFTTLGWDTRATINGQSGSTNITRDVALLSTHTGTGAEAGIVYIRFDSTASNQQLRTYELLVAGVNIGQTVGYVDGAIWIDTINGTAGTTPFVNGTGDNPVDSLADAMSLKASTGIKRFHLSAGSSVTFIEAHENEYWKGQASSIALGGQSVTGTFFECVYLSGISTGATICFNCLVNGVSGLIGNVFGSCLQGTITLAVGSTHFMDCNSFGPEVGGAPTLDLSAGNCFIGLRNYSGKMTVSNLGAGDILSFDSPAGQLILDATCTGGEVRRRGLHDFTNNGAGVTVTLDTIIFDSTTGYVYTAAGGLTAADVWSYAGIHGRTLTAFGAGANDYVYTVTDSVTGLPVQGANVWISTDVGGGNVIWSGDTDANGIAIDDNGAHPQLDNGAYYFWVSKPGYTPSNPDLENVP